MTRSPESDPAAREWPVAYCPPGKSAITSIALQIKGYDVARVTEHPWLDDSMGVILVADPGELIPDPAPAAGLSAHLLAPVPAPDPPGMDAR